MTTAKEVLDVLHTNHVYPDQLIKSKGVFVYRSGYFYRHGQDTKTHVNKVLSTFPDAKIIDSGDHWAAFRGGASVAKQSHFYVKFEI